MLVRRILSCKRRPLRMWEFNPEGPWTILHFFGMTLEGMCKLFFGPQAKCPNTTEDAVLSCNRPDTQVGNPETEHFVYIYHNIILKTIRGQEWLSKAERIRCLAPLPEGSPSPTIAKMLGRVLSKIPSGKGEGKGSEAELHTLHIQTRGIFPLLRRIVGKGRPEPPPRAGRRGPLPKTWKRGRLNKGRELHQRALP